MFKYFVAFSILFITNCENPSSSNNGSNEPTSYQCGGTGIIETHYSYTCTKPDTKTNSSTDSSTINSEVTNYEKDKYACSKSSKELGGITYYEYTCVKTDSKTNTSTDSSLINTEVSNFEIDGYTCSKSDEEKEEQCDPADNMCLCQTNCDKYSSTVCSYYISAENSMSKCLVIDCTVSLLGYDLTKQNSCIDNCRESAYNSTNTGDDPDNADFTEWPKNEWYRNNNAYETFVKPGDSSPTCGQSVSVPIGSNGKYTRNQDTSKDGDCFDGFSDPKMKPCMIYKVSSNGVQVTYRGYGLVNSGDIRDISGIGIIHGFFGGWEGQDFIEARHNQKYSDGVDNPDCGWDAIYNAACPIKK